MGKKTGIRILAWMLMVSVLVSLLAPAGAKAETGGIGGFYAAENYDKKRESGRKCFRGRELQRFVLLEL